MFGPAFVSVNLSGILLFCRAGDYPDPPTRLLTFTLPVFLAGPGSDRPHGSNEGLTALYFHAQPSYAVHLLIVKVDCGQTSGLLRPGTLLDVRSRMCPIRLHHAGTLDLLVAGQLLGQGDLNKLQRIRYGRWLGHERIVRSGADKSGSSGSIATSLAETVPARTERLVVTAPLDHRAAD
ncbi:MAG: hypothetical protein EOO81_05320 [Oxalobacteraceae bacterium]|nr:MAG: hypothetical protein EOO81_05320 [Oxalobacteraceae bacterium]